MSLPNSAGMAVSFAMGWRRTLRFAALCAMIGAVGCGAKSSSTIHGKVTLDGEPVTDGSIALYSLAASGSKAAAAIEQGSYAISAQDELQPGMYRVEINWQKPTGKKISSADPGIMTDERREVIPAKFNTNSTLTIEIGSGDEAKDFALSSK